MSNFKILIKIFIAVSFNMQLPWAYAYHFTDQEFFGLAKTVHDIRQNFPPQEYIYIGVGRSPAPIIAYLQEYGDKAINLPLTWSDSKYEGIITKIWREQKNGQNQSLNLVDDFDQLEKKLILASEDKMKLKNHFNRFLLPAIEEGLRTGKKLLLMDFVSTGKGLFLTNLYMNDYLKKIGLQSRLQVEYLAIGVDGNLDLYFNSRNWHSYILDKVETLEFHSLLVLSAIKKFAEYGNFLVDDARSASEKITPQPQYQELISAIKAHHPHFQKQISFHNHHQNIQHLFGLAFNIKSKIIDGTCRPDKTLTVFNIDNVLTVDESSEHYPVTLEHSTALQVKKIQNMGITTMGITNRLSFANSMLPTKFQKTASDLQKLDIDFQQSSNLIESGLKAENLWLTSKFIPNGGHIDGPQSVFYQGIYSMGNKQTGPGQKLEQLLRKSKLLPDQLECLFYVDNSLENIESVNEYFKYKLNMYKFHLQLPTNNYFLLQELDQNLSALNQFAAYTCEEE